MPGRSTTRMAAVLVAAAIGVLGGPVGAATSEDPPWSVDEADLDAALDCPAFAHPDREPVLLVHGTGATGPEQFGWNWLVALPPLGFDVCTVTYPDRGLGDQQVSAEYVAHAVLAMHETTGRAVDLVGHSQGASMSRWAVRWWPSVQEVLDDVVSLAGPHHGLGDEVEGEPGSGRRVPEAFLQFAADSRFVTLLDEGDETPGDVDWTSLASADDGVVRPPETSYLDLGAEDARVVNVLLQDLCPGRVVDHMAMGTTDRLAFDLAVDAMVNDGPADPGRLDLGPDCATADAIVEDTEPPTSLGDVLAGGIPDLHLAREEPPTKAYALGVESPRASPTLSPTPTPDPTPTEPSTPLVPEDLVDPAEEADVLASSSSGSARPVTGGGLAVVGVVGALVARVAWRRRTR